jgi:squalene-hopene/tetraprenyl-beta-curcumene cyclase
LLKTQRPDGAWAPLWFGNQHAAEIENLTYGTSRVLRLGKLLPTFDLGIQWLMRNQNLDGGWGGRSGTPSSIEETALAVDALVEIPHCEATGRGVEFLRTATRNGTHFPPSPIGFYFANLWYYEALYPMIFTVAALVRVDRMSKNIT